MQSPEENTNSIDVRYVADLARIDLTDAETERFGRELRAVVDYIALLSEVDVEGIEPTAHAIPLVNVMREDRVGDCLPRNAVLANAPEVLNEEYVRVPVVIEAEEVQ